MIGGFRAWERRRERRKEQPLVHFRLLQIPAMRSGLTTFLFQNLILMGVFFAIPLYLQVVQGFDAFQTGVRMLPVSVTLFVTALVGSRLAGRYPARTIVRAGLALLLAACSCCCWRRSSRKSRRSRSRSRWACWGSAWA